MKTLLKVACYSLASAVFMLGALAADAADQPQAASAALPKSFQIRSQKFGSMLRPKDANGADGAPIVLYPGQPWKCMTWKLRSAGESRFQLENHFTSKTFAAETGGDKPQPAVIQVPLSVGPIWLFTKLGDGSYKITDSKSGKALTAVKDENRSSLMIVVETWHEGAEQKWELIETDPKDLTM